MAVVEMGDESTEVFRSLQQVREHGLPYWWLSVYQCRQCRRWWLVAQEERQNDVFCFRLLREKEIERLIRYNSWPEDFHEYHELLRLGAEAGKRVTFLDPFNSSLVRTIADIAREHPGISVAEIASLLNLEMELAAAIARKVVVECGVDIDLSSDAG